MPSRSRALSPFCPGRKRSLHARSGQLRVCKRCSPAPRGRTTRRGTLTGGSEYWGKYDTDEVEFQGLQWAGLKDLRPSTVSPLYSVVHELSVSLTCTYDLEAPGGKVAREKLGFKVPLNFARVAPRIQAANAPSDALVLPVYSQLYDTNGERKIDYSTPLPLYTPKLENEPLLPMGADDNASVTGVNVYHGVNDLDGEVEKRHTSVVVAGESCQATRFESIDESETCLPFLFFGLSRSARRMKSRRLQWSLLFSFRLVSPT